MIQQSAHVFAQHTATVTYHIALVYVYSGVARSPGARGELLVGAPPINSSQTYFTNKYYEAKPGADTKSGGGGGGGGCCPF